MGVILAIVFFICYVIYRGSKKIMPKPLKGVPVIPVSHTLLGHPEQMLHPLRHVFRLHCCDTANTSIYQLLLMKHVSVFVNDCKEAAKVIIGFKDKGPIYSSFRYDPNIPDLYASDNKNWSKRHELLSPAIQATSVKKDEINKSLLEFLNQSAESAKPVDILRLFTLFALDTICSMIFQYELGAVDGSEEGAKLYESLQSLLAGQASQGYYKTPGARSVPKEELVQASAVWRAFLDKLVAVQKSEAVQFRVKHGTLNPETIFGHALLVMQEQDQEFTDMHVKAEIHQVLRHGHECIAGQLVWLFVALHRNRKVRRQLEQELRTGFGEFGEAVIKECLRRYPVVGNMIVRTVSEPEARLGGIFEVPVGTPLHLHMWSLHNAADTWDKPQAFLPDRWLGAETETDTWRATGDSGETDDAEPVLEESRCPRCPFLATQQSHTQYDGVGHEPESLSYFPFSAGDRICPGRWASLDVMRGVVTDVCSRFRLDPETAYWEEDPGVSANSTVLPALAQSTAVVVRKVGIVDEAADKDKEEGWLDDDADDEK